MRSDRRPTVVPTVFDESLLANDLKRLPQAAKSALCKRAPACAAQRRHPRDRLKRCQADARDGTDLAGCVKTYVPWPDGPWGIVFRAGEDPRRPFALYTIAYGRLHPGARRISVYQLAHQRLHRHSRRP